MRGHENIVSLKQEQTLSPHFAHKVLWIKEAHGVFFLFLSFFFFFFLFLDWSSWEPPVLTWWILSSWGFASAPELHTSQPPHSSGLHSESFLWSRLDFRNAGLNVSIPFVLSSCNILLSCEGRELQGGSKRHSLFLIFLGMAGSPPHYLTD